MTRLGDEPTRAFGVQGAPTAVRMGREGQGEGGSEKAAAVLVDIGKQPAGDRESTRSECSLIDGVSAHSVLLQS
ncbi:hypothetical protein ADK41_12655 [Streptomyces caelestis]|uniref:Uncharacterized protein n=1 Tax=Streptomyces caelestis TaxID=36816 RepID=A0A0N0S5Z1_9ACTN|nr:hypothetical protein ADK41_12655 [Streptomyces caelestis]